MINMILAGTYIKNNIYEFLLSQMQFMFVIAIFKFMLTTNESIKYAEM